MFVLCAVVALFCLSGCGFQPVYGEKNTSSLQNIGIIIEAPRDKMGQRLKQNLEDKLSQTGRIKPEYRLDVTLISSASPIGISRDGTVSRFNVSLQSNYTLTRLSDNKLIKQDIIKHVGSYNNQANLYFSTYVAEQDAVKRGIVEIAELYRGRLAAFLSDTAHEN